MYIISRLLKAWRTVMAVINHLIINIVNGITCKMWFGIFVSHKFIRARYVTIIVSV